MVKIYFGDQQSQAQANLTLPAFSQARRGVTLTVTNKVTLLATVQAKLIPHPLLVLLLRDIQPLLELFSTIRQTIPDFLLAGFSPLVT